MPTSLSWDNRLVMHVGEEVPRYNNSVLVGLGLFARQYWQVACSYWGNDSKSGTSGRASTWLSL